MKKALVRLMVVLFLSAASSQVHASFIADLTGNSTFSGNATITSYVNFTVFANPKGSDWRTGAGVPAGNITTLAGTIDGQARTICLYQITRDAAAADTNLGLGTFTIPTDLLGATTWRGAGVLSGTSAVFSSGGAVRGDGGTGSLNTIGATAAVGTPTTGVAAPTFVADPGGAVVPTFLGTLSITPTFSFAGGIGLGGHSPVFVMTSDGDIVAEDGFQVVSGPATGAVSGLVPAGSATAPIPVSNPEPCSLVLLGLGMIGGGAGVVWKRRRKKSSPAV